jgi:hypothetical protein
MKFEHSGKTVKVTKSEGGWAFSVTDWRGNSIEGTRYGKDAAVKAGQHYAEKGW